MDERGSNGWPPFIIDAGSVVVQVLAKVSPKSHDDAALAALGKMSLAE